MARPNNYRPPRRNQPQRPQQRPGGPGGNFNQRPGPNYPGSNPMRPRQQLDLWGGNGKPPGTLRGPAGGRPSLNYGGQTPPSNSGDRIPSFNPNGQQVGNSVPWSGEPIRGTNSRQGNIAGRNDSFMTGAQNQAPGSNQMYQRLLDQWRAGENRGRIRQRMMRATNYNDGTPDTGEVATWLRRQMMPAAQQDQQRIRNLTQTLGSRLADPYSPYNLGGQVQPERMQGHTDELGGLLQDYGNYQFDWGTGDNVQGGWGGNANRAEINQRLGVGSPQDIWGQLGFGGQPTRPPAATQPIPITDGAGTPSPYDNYGSFPQQPQQQGPRRDSRMPFSMQDLLQRYGY